MDPEMLARMIDHTLLKADATTKEFETLCQEARDNKFYAVCVPPQWVTFAKQQLRNSSVKVATVIGFPHGNTMTQVKIYEAETAADAGADEIDMVVQIGKLREGESEVVRKEIEAVVRASKAKNPSMVIKVILETGALDKSQKVLGCRIVSEAGADFVKTSTGFHDSGGATLSDVALLRKNSARSVGVKAAGGIRDLKTALGMIGAGANRLGCSASVKILNELKGEGSPTVSTEKDLSARKRLQYEYVWDWFAYHAQQRTSVFNYFLVIVGALMTGFTWLMARSEPPLFGVAIAVAVIGAGITTVFMLLDCRNRDLVHRAEKILKRLEADEIFRDEKKEPLFKGLLLHDSGMETERRTERWRFVRHGFLVKSVEGFMLVLFTLMLVAAIIYGSKYGFFPLDPASKHATTSVQGTQSPKATTAQPTTGAGKAALNPKSP